MSDEAPVRLATYGTLMPGEENHWVVRNLARDPDDWAEGHVRGWTYTIGFGPAEGYPGITLDPGDGSGERVRVAVLTTDRLARHWPEIDDFEGPGYRRVECDVELDTGDTVRAWIYETDPTAE